MMRIIGVEISKKSKFGEPTAISKKFENIVNLIYTVCAMSEMIMYTMFAIGSMIRITAVEISKNSKCAKQSANWKSLKTL